MTPERMLEIKELIADHIYDGYYSDTYKLALQECLLVIENLYTTYEPHRTCNHSPIKTNSNLLKCTKCGWYLI